VCNFIKKEKKETTLSPGAKFRSTLLLVSGGPFYRVPCGSLFLFIGNKTGTVLYGVSCKTGNKEREKVSYGSFAPSLIIRRDISGYNRIETIFRMERE